MKDFNDEHFHSFAASLELLLGGYDMPDGKGRNEHQKNQVEGLVAAEQEFRKLLKKLAYGRVIYEDFIKYVRKERRNILAARPFFRERDEVFKEHISGALQTNNWERVSDFGINSVFINLVLSRHPGIKPKSPIRTLATKIFSIRKELIDQNIPLAISRAKIFKAKTPASPHMDYMDLVQVSIEGLINAVDKYVLPYRSQFRGVIIGRSTGNLISNYSEPMLHFYPGDRRKLYQANKSRRGLTDLDKICEDVNTRLPPDMQTTKDEIQQLLNASSHLSLDQSVGPGVEDESTYLDFTTDPGARPDEIIERRNLGEKLGKHLSELTLFERKALVLKGLCSEENL